MSQQPTVAQTLAMLSRHLTGDAAPLESRMLLSHVLRRPQSWLIAHSDDTLGDVQSRRLTQLLARRRGGEPMAYVLGEREFWDMTLAVTPAVLIPRPETELLVEQALVHINAHGRSRVLDLGTGSGAIAIAIARERPLAEVCATDACVKALSVAQRNVASCCPGRIELRRGHWFEPVAGERFDVVVSNPPYVASNDPCLQYGEVAHEPRLALDGGSDGLHAYRQLLAKASEHLVNGGHLLFEHGFEQSEALRQLLATSGFQAIDTACDLAGHPRVTSARAAA